MPSLNILGIGDEDRELLGGGGVLEIRQPDPAVTTPAQALGQLYTNVTDEIRRQRAISAERGLWDEATGLPTAKGLLDVAKQYGDTMLMGTTAPGVKAAVPIIGEGGAISVGGKTVGRVKYDHGDSQTRIADIQLDPSAQGQGTGSAVIKQIQDEAAARGNPVVLTTDAMRGKAAQADQRRLYERLGFEKNKGPAALTEKVGGRTIREEYVWRPPREAGQENR